MQCNAMQCNSWAFLTHRIHAALAVVVRQDVHELEFPIAEARVQEAEVQARHAVGCPVALAAVPPSSP